ncbi:MAG: helix-turn-helix domain-containing protein [Arcobacter butzleri]|jgi:transcriptional regulator with XRE-family HTH domain|nr:helix-turn-helix domain-containing protein [Arcobacteraceae bacterium]NLO17391.1 helix-turn-helix domain-containing protein [Aliarcobacter butzleri]
MYKFNEKIKVFREKLKLTQEEMAKQLEIGVRTYIRYEKGERFPTIDIVYKLARLDNINYNWLLGDQDNMIIEEQNSSTDGIICINTEDYVYSAEIKELFELLKDVPKSWIRNMTDKLKQSLNAINDNFK